MKVTLIGSNKSKLRIEKLTNLKITNVLAPTNTNIIELENNPPELIIIDSNSLKKMEVIEDKFIGYKNKKNYSSVNLNDIIYFKAKDKHVIAYSTKKELQLSESLKNLENKYKEIFVRPNRNYLVAKKFIKNIKTNKDNSKYILINNIEIPVSRRNISKIKGIILSER